MLDTVTASGLANLLSASSNARTLTRTMSARAATTVRPTVDVAAGANDQALRRKNRRFEDALASLGTTDRTISDALKGLRDVRQMLTQARAVVAEGRASLSRGTVETVTNTVTATVTNSSLRVDTTTNERLRVDSTTNERLRVDTTTNENLRVDTVTNTSTTTPTVTYALSVSGEQLVNESTGQVLTGTSTLNSIEGPQNNGVISIRVGAGPTRSLTITSGTTVDTVLGFIRGGDDGTTATLSNGVITIGNTTGAAIQLTDGGGRTVWEDMGFQTETEYRPTTTVTTSTSTSSTTDVGTPTRTSSTTVEGDPTLVGSTTSEGSSTLVGSTTSEGETVTTTTTSTGDPVETSRTSREIEGAFDRNAFAAEFNRLVSAIDSALFTSAVLQGASYRMTDATGSGTREVETTALSSERLGLRSVANTITTGELDRMSASIRAAEETIDAATRRFTAEAEMASLIRGALEGGLTLSRPGAPTSASNDLARMLSGLMGSITTGSATTMLRGMRLS